MPVFLTKEVKGGKAYLDADESRHLLKVLRLKENDPVSLVDGKGNLFEGLIENADQSGIRVAIHETRTKHLERNYKLHLGIAPTKSTDRFEWFLEKATEIGIDEITPIYCERSERNRIRQDRSERILLSAMKQSGRAYLPLLNPMISLVELLDQSDAFYKYIAHCETVRKDIPEKPVMANKSWLILIGPEGDFSPEEIIMAKEKNFRDMNLGEAVYRTETAGILSCQIIHQLNKGG